jgi:DNA-3-methyladenine glycosylase I
MDFTPVLAHNPLSQANSGDTMTKKRCAWCSDDPIYMAYHDKEWGKPLKNGKKLFAMLQLEGMQAGLNWITILKKRDSITQAFCDLDPDKLKTLTDKKFTTLMGNEGIIRNRLKIKAVYKNAAAFREHFKTAKKFSDFLWSYVDHQPIINYPKKLADIPAQTPLSEQLSKDLKKLGFTFVGPTIIYAFMQAVGMVNDHSQDCFIAECPKAKEKHAPQAAHIP